MAFRRTIGGPSPAAKPGAPVAAKQPAKVFISHSSKNADLAIALCAEFESNGIRCWIAPRDIRAGASWGRAIIEGLSGCRAVVILLTEASNRSQHVMKEIERAVNKRIPLLPVRVQPVQLTPDLEYFLSTAQWLDATEPPFTQHLRPIRHRVRDLLVEQSGGQTATVPIIDTSRAPRRRRQRGLVAGIAWLAIAVAALVGAWGFGPEALRELVPGIATRPPTASRQSPPAAAAATVSPPADSAPRREPPRTATPTAPPRERPLPAASSLLREVESKSRIAERLATFAATRLPTYHREVLLVQTQGELQPGKVSDGDAEIMASCTLAPNESAYKKTAQELGHLLSIVAQQQGTIVSDGLRSSESNTRDARPLLLEFRKNAFDTGYTNLLAIFADNSVRSLVHQHAIDDRCPFVSFPSIFLIYDDTVTGGRDAGVDDLRWETWNPLLRQEGSGIVLLLESWRNSFRHTTWKWFHLGAADYATLAARLPRRFKCIFTLTDSANTEVESDFYLLQNYAVGGFGNIESSIFFTPFFVDQSCQHYIPTVTLTKPIVVLRNDVPRIRDFRVGIEAAPPER